MGYPLIGFLRTACVCLLLSGFSALTLAQSKPPTKAEDRVALVIGNSAYPMGALENPKNEATEVSAAFKRLGFDSELILNATKADMDAALRRFGSKADRAYVAIIFYAGHGVQVNGDNYLIPIGANPQSVRDLKRDLVKLDDVIDDMGSAKVKLVFFDACRDNRLSRSFSRGGRGMAAPVEATGTLISFATKHGSTASDGVGRHSPYSAALLAELQNPSGVEIETMLRRVQQTVRETTRKQQEPWRYGSLDGDFYFRPPVQVANIATQPPIVVPTDPSANDRALWDTVKDSKSPDEIRAYLKQFPTGLFAGVAQARLKALQSTQVLTDVPDIASTRPPTEPILIAAAEKRVALIIGNSDYKQGPLVNPVNDATDIANALQAAGFGVILRRNVNAREMRQAIREFGAELRRAQVGLFYFAGHSVQVRGLNYLVPVAADIQSEDNAEDLAIDASVALRIIEESQAKVSVVILDASRDNPFSKSFRSVSRGLAQMTAATGSLIAFATAPGSVALDGSGRNSIYTKHLLASLAQPDTDILRVFQRTRAAVMKETGGRQAPWESSSLVGDFYFRPPVFGKR